MQRRRGVNTHRFGSFAETIAVGGNLGFALGRGLEQDRLATEALSRAVQLWWTGDDEGACNRRRSDWLAGFDWRAAARIDLPPRPLE